MDNDKIIGFASVYFHVNYITIEDIVSTKKGVGTALLKEIEKADSLFVADVGPNNTRARAFMEKNGYKLRTLTYTK